MASANGDADGEDARATGVNDVCESLVDDENTPAKNCFRLVLLGSSKVGKTAIVSRFLDNRYDDKYTPTIENFHRKIYRIRGEAYRLDILDTSGNNPFPAMRRLSFMTAKIVLIPLKNVRHQIRFGAEKSVYLIVKAEPGIIIAGDLFILVYSIDNRESFQEVKSLQEQIFETKTGAGSGAGWRKRKPYVPMVVVGNKCELSRGSSGTLRCVETWELLKLADGKPCCGCLEASAKRNVNIEEIFLKLFMLAQLPTEMTPSLHRKVTPSYVVTSSPRGTRRRMTLRRRLSDASSANAALGAVSTGVRRPSIRTDLMIVKAKRTTDSRPASSSEVAINAMTSSSPALAATTTTTTGTSCVTPTRSLTGSITGSKLGGSKKCVIQ